MSDECFAFREQSWFYRKKHFCVEAEIKNTLHSTPKPPIYWYSVRYIDVQLVQSGVETLHLATVLYSACYSERCRVQSVFDFQANTTRLACPSAPQGCALVLEHPRTKHVSSSCEARSIGLRGTFSWPTERAQLNANSSLFQYHIHATRFEQDSIRGWAFSDAVVISFCFMDYGVHRVKTSVFKSSFHLCIYILIYTRIVPL